MKVMLVTGGGRGIGAATARLAAARGWAVCVNYRRDRAALTHNLGWVLHSNRQEAEALAVLEAAARLRQELLDSQPDHLDYRSELAGCWNDIGLPSSAS